MKLKRITNTCAIFAITFCLLLVGAGCSQTDTKKTTNDSTNATQKQSSNNKNEKAVQQKDSNNKTNNTTQNVEQQNSKPVTNTNIEDIKQDLSDQLGEGETFKDISVNGNNITLKVDLGNNTKVVTKEDLAYTRYSSLTDHLLSQNKWQVITVNFIGVGTISMNSSEAVEQEVGGQTSKYFPRENIEQNLKK
ncbi:hypothetical protein [Clostridium tyrobutyricum]|uniref:hypothetical protein n=1 Tax=Clostridium tyrobutyricum TaxID=1519 RepID=UPI00189D3B0A|nr:hypothetical protein [Clostridium tyrobutyricum]